jgi:hypothetical protein
MEIKTNCFFLLHGIENFLIQTFLHSKFGQFHSFLIRDFQQWCVMLPPSHITFGTLIVHRLKIWEMEKDFNITSINNIFVFIHYTSLIQNINDSSKISLSKQLIICFMKYNNSNAQLLMMSIALMRRSMLLCIYLERVIGTRQLHWNWPFQIQLAKKKKTWMSRKKTRRKQQ